jgi:hypothetical protein
MSRFRETTVMRLYRRQLLWGGMSLPALIATGCQLPGSGPPPREFRLTQKSTFPEGMPQVDWALVAPAASRSNTTLGQTGSIVHRSWSSPC